eukprot:jgi/Chrzof1/291/Cz01g10040.t1
MVTLLQNAVHRLHAASAAVGPTSDPSGFVTAVADTADDMNVADIKAALLDSFFGTERGLSGRSEVRAEINELITQLEAKNPTPSPTETLAMLDGDWKLVYTSNSELLAILALSKLPFVTIGDITQHVDSGSNTVENKVQISVPLSRTAFSTRASFEVRSPKRLQVRFEKGVVQTPQLLSDIEVPNSLSVMGQNIDLSQVRGLLQPAAEGLSGIISQVGNLISQTPNLSFPISTDNAQTWLLTTYLDEDTRITRGDGGSVFILVKEVSISPPAPAAAAADAPPTTFVTSTGSADLV